MRIKALNAMGYHEKSAGSQVVQSRKMR